MNETQIEKFDILIKALALEIRELKKKVSDIENDILQINFRLNSGEFQWS